ncbi:hypothetical protein D3C74_156140 [compost metagenome]
MNTLFMRIFLFFSCLLLGAGVILGLTLYRSSAQLVEQSMGMQAQAVAERAVQLIDINQYAELSTGTPLERVRKAAPPCITMSSMGLLRM